MSLPLVKLFADMVPKRSVFLNGKRVDFIDEMERVGNNPITNSATFSLAYDKTMYAELFVYEFRIASKSTKNAKPFHVSIPPDIVIMPIGTYIAATQITAVGLEVWIMNDTITYNIKSRDDVSGVFPDKMVVDYFSTPAFYRYGFSATLIR